MLKQSQIKIKARILLSSGYFWKQLCVTYAVQFLLAVQSNNSRLSNENANNYAWKDK